MIYLFIMFILLTIQSLIMSCFQFYTCFLIILKTKKFWKYSVLLCFLQTCLRSIQLQRRRRSRWKLSLPVVEESKSRFSNLCSSKSLVSPPKSMKKTEETLLLPLLLLLLRQAPTTPKQPEKKNSSLKPILRSRFIIIGEEVSKIVYE